MTQYVYAKIKLNAEEVDTIKKKVLMLCNDILQLCSDEIKMEIDLLKKYTAYMYLHQNYVLKKRNNKILILSNEWIKGERANTAAYTDHINIYFPFIFVVVLKKKGIYN